MYSKKVVVMVIALLCGCQGSIQSESLSEGPPLSHCDSRGIASSPYESFKQLPKDDDTYYYPDYPDYGEPYVPYPEYYYSYPYYHHPYYYRDNHRLYDHHINAPRGGSRGGQHHGDRSRAHR